MYKIASLIVFVSILASCANNEQVVNSSVEDAVPVNKTVTISNKSGSSTVYGSVGYDVQIK